MCKLIYSGMALLPLLAACGKSTSSGASDATDAAGSGSANVTIGGGPSSGGTGNTASSSSGGSGGVTAGGTGGTWEALPTDLDGEPIYTRVQRLTNSQWQNSVSRILRLDTTANLAQDFQAPVAGLTDFTNNERVLWVGDREFLDYETAAEAAAALATGTAEALEALYPGTDPEGFVESLGLRAFRRPLFEAEVSKYLEVFELGERLYGAGFANGAALVIRAMLQSPHFLYRTELGEAGTPLSGYELAAKLSFWLLDATPNDELLDAAARGELDSPEGVEAIAAAMLDTSEAALVMWTFHSQLYQLNELVSVVKNDPGAATPALNQELVDVSYAFFDSVYRRGRGLFEILTSTRGYVGPELAPLYGLDTDVDGLLEVDLGPERLGYFMQVPFLMLHANDRTPNPIHRGIRLHRSVLCSSLPPPSSGSVPPLPEPDPAQTNRERTTAATSACGAACHGVYIDPLGFAFEGFDGMGQVRDADNGQPIDSSGSYPFASGVESFSDAEELMQIIAASSEAHLCYSKMLSGYALGRDIVVSDRPLLDGLSEVSREDSLEQLVLALVRDPAFRIRQEAP